MKSCSKCREIKPLDSFAVRSKNKDGHDYYCKVCRVQSGRKYRDENREKSNDAVARSRKKMHWSLRLIRTSKSSANARNLEHELTDEDVKLLWELQNGCCYWLGVPLSEDAELPDRHPLKPSLDRLDNSKGYIKDNVVITSTFANLGRSNTTVEDFSEFLNLIQQEKLYGNLNK